MKIIHTYCVLHIVLRSSWSKAFLVKSLNVLISNGYKKGGKPHLKVWPPTTYL